MTKVTPSLYDRTLSELTSWVIAQGEPSYRARQIFQELYHRGTATPKAMALIPKALRDKLAVAFPGKPLLPVETQRSGDGTVKALFRLPDDQLLETVLIPADARQTVCVSTQVGCAYACAFCDSGQAGFERNLAPGEIVQQVLLVQNLAEGATGDTGGEASAASPAAKRGRTAERSAGGRTRSLGQRVTNVVFMGMGEPLANYDNLLKAIRVLNAPEGLNIGARKITVSTVGLVPMIERLSKEGLQVELAISLHAPDDELRGKLMPVNAKYPLGQLIPACRAYSEATKRLITFEYILMDHVNDGPEQARELARLLKGLLSKVNLIPCHPTPKTPWKRPELSRMLAFERLLKQKGIRCTLRRSRGLDIEGACGQLRLRHLEAA